ncbi:MAG TPA: hypothetical protein VIL00_14065 [Pseudonocardiaceae bacterium]
MAGRKYRPLTELLVGLARQGETVVELGFDEIAALVGGLPGSAYRLRQWWSNSYLVQGTSWGSAGWRVTHVDFERQRVRFSRHVVDSTVEVWPGPARRSPFRTGT